MPEVTVSVHMITYNHQDYVKDAIEGVLMQKTDFPVELMISDDCSTDNTREIIARYAAKYPKVIKPVFRERNLGSMRNFVDTFQYCTGTYIAMCEGDDYWTDPLKLQKQVDFLKRNPSCRLCFHPSTMLFVDGTGRVLEEGLKGPEERIVPSAAVIGGVYIRMVTMVFAAEIMRSVPDFLQRSPYGDLPLQLLCAHRGPVGYLGGRPMSVYRRGAVGSWSAEQGEDKKTQKAWALKRLKDHFTCFDLFDDYTGHKYAGILKKRKEVMRLAYILQMQSFSNKLEVAREMSKNVKPLIFRDWKITVRIMARYFLGKNLYERVEAIKENNKK